VRAKIAIGQVYAGFFHLLLGDFHRGFVRRSHGGSFCVVFVVCSLVFRVRYFSFKERVETVLFMGKDSKPKREKRDKKKYARARKYTTFII